LQELGPCQLVLSYIPDTSTVGKFMPYRFERDFATVQDGVRKIAIELIDDAIETANHRGLDFHETVHSLRKACKKLRGLIRVVRPVFDDYRTENAVFRDSGRHFSLLRDGGVMIETYDGLLEEYKDQVDRSKFVRIRRRFTVLQKEMEAHEDFATTIDKFRQTMKSSRKRVRRWHVDDDGFDAIEPGVKKSYKGAQRAMMVASNTPSPDAIHEWRKRVKDHWYHSRLLSEIWRPVMKTHCEIADELGDLLGKHHDLEVFGQKMAADDFGDWTDQEVLMGLARRRQKTIEEEALSIGARLLAESPGSLMRRWRSYWDAWHQKSPRKAVLAA